MRNREWGRERRQGERKPKENKGKKKVARRARSPGKLGICCITGRPEKADKER